MRCISLAAADLLSDLIALGCKLELEGEDRVAVIGRLSDDLRQRIREHKAGLLALVKAGEHKWRQESHWHAQIEEAGGSRWLVLYSLDKPGDFKAHRLTDKEDIEIQERNFPPHGS